jgi:hypothetical protein
MTRTLAANSLIVDQAALIYDLRTSRFTEMAEEERAKAAGNFNGREIYAWGTIVSSTEDNLILKAASSREEYIILCEYPTKSKRENLNLLPNEFTCIKMKISDITVAVSDGVEQWSLYGVYDSLCVKKANFFQRQFEERIKQADRVITKRVKKTSLQPAAVPAAQSIRTKATVNGIVKSKKEITGENIRKLVAEKRQKESELEDTRNVVWSAFRKSVAISLFFLFIVCFYKMHEGHSFFNGINLGTTTIAIIIGIIVFVRTNM